ncbi:MAG: hypothetical protein II070_06630 [Treponema sp.]|nr:hypothetical protein [Treponema sp.]
MKLRMATVFFAVAILTLFTTACGGGGEGGSGGEEDDPYSVYTDDSGYDHAFGGMREGYYNYDHGAVSFYLSSDGSWMGWDDDPSDRNYWHLVLQRYTVEEDGLHLLQKQKVTGWSERYTVTSSDDTSFTLQGLSGTFRYSGN